MQDKIVAYIQTTYAPEAIILAGSRASGTHKDNGDWDLFVITPEKHNGVFADLDGELLDVTFKKLPETTGVLSNPFQPLWPVQVLYDVTNGKLDTVLQNNKKHTMRDRCWHIQMAVQIDY